MHSAIKDSKKKYPKLALHYASNPFPAQPYICDSPHVRKSLNAKNDKCNVSSEQTNQVLTNDASSAEMVQHEPTVCLVKIQNHPRIEL